MPVHSFLEIELGRLGFISKQELHHLGSYKQNYDAWSVPYPDYIYMGLYQRDETSTFTGKVNTFTTVISGRGNGVVNVFSFPNHDKCFFTFLNHNVGSIKQ